MRILVVEDEKKVANTLREVLEAEHYDVRVAATGASALGEYPVKRLRMGQLHPGGRYRGTRNSV